ncbi:MAG: TMEM43 family protein [Planctomycetales bacterium]|nr:TMEM43 family protein [Planctomycetales bacterium]
MVFVRKSVGKRVGNVIVGTVFGFLLSFAAVVLLAWNERDAVRQTGAITEMERVAMADVSAERIEPANQGKLIHAAHTAETEEVLEFAEFGIRENAIRLRWESWIYQWTEDRRERDNHTEYTYTKEWVSEPVNSSHFHEAGHSNDGSQQHFHDGSQLAQQVAFGEFQLSSGLIKQIRNERDYPLSETQASQVEPVGRIHNGDFYTGDPNAPQIGDERVEVFMIDPRQEVTVMAEQHESTFRPYQTRVGIAKEILYMGLLSKEQVIAQQRTEAAIKRWFLRAGGFIGMWIGLCLIMGPVRAVLSFIPFVGKLLEGAIVFVAFLVAAVISLVTIAIAWFVVRPLLSGVLLAMAIGAAIWLYRQKSSGQDVVSAAAV